MLGTSVATKEKDNFISKARWCKAVWLQWIHKKYINLHIELSWVQGPVELPHYENIKLHLFLCNKKPENTSILLEFCTSEDKAVNSFLKHL